MKIHLSNLKTSDIKTVNQSYEGLLQSHSELLRRKNVHSKWQLLQIIKMDLDKLTHALLEVRARDAWSVLSNFFPDHHMMLPSIIDRLKEESIDHLGFEIHEPLDLVLHGLNHWMEKTRSTFYCSLEIQKTLRFPASQAFQKRVGGYTEIMRLWVQLNQRTLLLELFDIHRPVDSFLSSELPKQLVHRDFNCLVTQTDAFVQENQKVEPLFEGDSIWHYAFQVKTPQDVIALHSDLEKLVDEDPIYILPYDAPVQNLGDGSFHTKIINQSSDLEIEFVAIYGNER